MPAAAVIPAPRAYTKVVAVEAFVVEFGLTPCMRGVSQFPNTLRVPGNVTLSKLKCFKKANANTAQHGMTIYDYCHIVVG